MFFYDLDEQKEFSLRDKDINTLLEGLYLATTRKNAVAVTGISKTKLISDILYLISIHHYYDAAFSRR
jgi:hypothetical protein